VSIDETIDSTGIICGGTAARPDRFPGWGPLVDGRGI